MVRRKSSGPRRRRRGAWRTAGWPACARADRPRLRMAMIWSRDEVRKSASSGSGWRRVLATAAAPRSSTRRLRTSASTAWRNRASCASWRSSASRAHQAVGRAAGAVRGRLILLFGQAGHEAVGIDGPHGAQHVIGAGHRPARFDIGVPFHEDARDGPHHDLVVLAEGGQQQVGQGRVIQGTECSRPGAAGAGPRAIPSAGGGPASRPSRRPARSPGPAQLGPRRPARAE